MIYICILYNFVFIYDGLSLTSSIHSITFLWDRTSDARYQGFCTSMEWGSIVPMPRAGRLQKVFMFGESTLCRSWSQADSWRFFLKTMWSHLEWIHQDSPSRGSAEQWCRWHLPLIGVGCWCQHLRPQEAHAHPLGCYGWTYAGGSTGKTGGIGFRIPGDLVLVEVPK